MNLTETTTDFVQRAVAYHGSLCPGLATGIQAARLALDEVGPSTEDGRVVAMAETDICALDAIAVLTGCTPGNRNLVVRDYGKNAYTFWRLADGKAVRISGRPAWDASYQALRAKVSSGSSSEAEKAQLAEATVAEAERILALDPRELFDVTPVSAPVPCTSQVDPWVTCERCREPVMEGRTRRRQGLQLCIPCFEVAAAAA